MLPAARDVSYRENALKSAELNMTLSGGSYDFHGKLNIGELAINQSGGPTAISAVLLPG